MRLQWRLFPLWFPICQRGFKAWVCCLSTVSFLQFAFSVGKWHNDMQSISQLFCFLLVLSGCSLQVWQALRWYISCGSVSLSLKLFSQIPLNPCKTLVLDVNYLTSQMAWNFTWILIMLSLCTLVIWKPNQRRSMSVDRKLYYLFCLNLSRAFWLPVLSSPVLATFLACQ